MRGLATGGAVLESLGCIHQQNDRVSVPVCEAVATDRHRHSPVATGRITTSQRLGYVTSSGFLGSWVPVGSVNLCGEAYVRWFLQWDGSSFGHSGFWKNIICIFQRGCTIPENERECKNPDSGGQRRIVVCSERMRVRIKKVVVQLIPPPLLQRALEQTN